MKWKFLFIYPLLIFLLSACNISKRTGDTSTPKPKTEYPKTETKIDSVTPKKDPVEPEEPQTKVEEPKSKGRKDIINAVLALPMDGSYDVGRFSEFVNGFNLASESMNTGRPKIKVNVVNIGNINSENEILAKTAFQNADLIVGGYQTSQVKTLARIAENKKIPFISIWNTSEGIVENNPYYVQLKPSLISYCENMADFVVHEIRPQMVLIIVESSKSKDASTISHYQKVYKDNNQQHLVVYSVVDGGEWKNTIAGYNNVVINIPNWENKTFVKNILHQINGIRKNKSITVTGMPQWTEWDQIDFNMFELLNVHLPVFNYVDKTIMNAALFDEAYFNKYNSWATMESYYGSDILYIIRKVSSALSAGKSFNPNEQITGNYFSNYKVSAYQPANLDGPKPIFTYSHNTYVTIEKFEGGRFVPVR